MNKSNLFNYVINELSQDTFIYYILEFHKKYFIKKYRNLNFLGDVVKINY